MEGKVVTVILLSSIICGVYAKEHVPVLIWNTQQSQEGLPAVSALQFMNYGTFQAKYLEPFKPKNILLFLQDALSVEDLSSHASELHHVSQWMESSHSLYLPNVEEAAHLAHDLPSHGYNAVSAGLPGYYNTSCVLLYLHNNTVVTLTHQNSTDSEVLVVDEGQSMGEAIGHCPGTADDKTANILIKYQNVESNKNHTYGKVKFQLNFEMANKGWTLTGVNGSFDTTEIYFKPISSEISGIPIFMSYACTQKVTFTAAVNNNTGSSNGLVKLVLGGVQMHPFTVKGKFGGAWDCVGFFTVSIWISLLATLLMVTILSVGMYMLSDIKTMDRFDDPKGQPIMVPNTD
ncbi:V-type proton ATPase subunit S1-like 2 [Homarus americanus]|uniref:V-type proton ATPase subunit S1-like 2 n=1 Tax=Homarus americanus TaxID=6706 RepID=A0A8J5KA26_HOMAM|nr:V-type proton ATPase subunit S1-like 2 [Homarus americanus]